MVVGRIKWCVGWWCVLWPMPTVFCLAFERERESVLNTCFGRGRTDVSNDTEPMVCTPKKCLPNKNVLQANSLREMSKWWCMSAVPRVFCVMRYSFRMTQRLPVVESSTENGLERSFSYLAVPSVSYISISVVRFSFPPNPPTETCFSERVAVEDRPNKETPLPNRGVSSNSDY